MNPSARHPLRVGLVSLGCAKNLVDAEIILGSLAQDGIEITNEPSLADVLVVNTCSFIDAAKEESIDAILEHAAEREASRPGQALVVAGCLSQRYPRQLPELMPEIDGFMGLDEVAQAPGLIRQAWQRRQLKLKSKMEDRRAVDRGRRSKVGHSNAKLETPNSKPTAAPVVTTSRRSQFIPDYATPRFRLTPEHLAYVKVAEGCNHPCSFCVIPRVRGSHRSRPQADILEECRRLLAEGVKELNLISQDTTYYGRDLRPDRRAMAPEHRLTKAAIREPSPTAGNLSTLLRGLNGLPGEFWVRILYTHPAHWTDSLIETIAECPKVARYIDVPLQHIHPVMLERMRRETTREYLVELIAKIRRKIPGIALRTTFIVGFPGESEACFEDLLSFIRETQFERLGVFMFSPEEGTRAACMSGQVPERLKRRRRDRAMAEQLKIARKTNADCVGRTLRVLTERAIDPGDALAPEVRSWEHGLVRRSDRRLDLQPGPWQVARGEADAPDIDGRVYVRGPVPIGQFILVRIIGHTDYDLIAEPV